MPDPHSQTSFSVDDPLPQRIPCDLGLDPWELPSVELYQRIVTGLQHMNAATDLPGVGVSSPPTPGNQPNKG